MPPFYPLWVYPHGPKRERGGGRERRREGGREGGREEGREGGRGKERKVNKVIKYMYTCN